MPSLKNADFQNAGFQERRLDCMGLELAVLERGQGPLLLCLHGWLDNAASFLPLLGALDTQGFRCVALDFPGHGKSDHRPHGVGQYFVDLVWALFEVLEHYPKEPVFLLGHSMGAGVASLYAGAFPEQVGGLGLLDGLGPFADSPEETPQTLAKALLATRKQTRGKQRIFSTIEQAAELRSKMGRISLDAARLLAQRGLKKSETNTEGYQWSHDPRLKSPSLVRLSEEQVRAFLKGIAAPTFLIQTADDRWERYQKQYEARKACVKNLQVEHVEGGHHVHLESPQKTALVLQKALYSFLDTFLKKN